MMEEIGELALKIGIEKACQALDIARASYYRFKHSRLQQTKESAPRPKPAWSLSAQERKIVLDLLNSQRFMDKAPQEVYATLLDEGRYLCSISTMYRILEENDEVRERRKLRRHPNYEKPELLATKPNEVWTWDITKLKGPQTWTYFYLYVILDIYSRYVVGWMVADCEHSALARDLIEQSLGKHNIRPGQLTIHSDRGPSMKSKPVAMLLSDLGVTKTHSRPYVSNDNPFSESQFKTLKYRPEFPERFGSIEDSQSFCRPFFHWYNAEHRHSGIALLTPEMVHYGRAEEVIKAREVTLIQAYEEHPERFPGKPGTPSTLPEAAWINKPAQQDAQS